MKKLSIAIAAVLAMAGANAATTALQTGSISNVTTDLTNVPIGSGFNLFNPALGTLTGVTLLWNWTATSTASLTNTSAQEQDFSWTSTLQFRLRDTPVGVNTTSSATLFSITDANLAANGGSLNLGTNTVSSPAGGISVAVPVANLGLFTGVGTSVFTCSTVTGSNFLGGGGNINVTQATTAGCGYSIQYTYTEPPVTTVPEPSSLALVGLALAGAGLVARRRKA